VHFEIARIKLQTPIFPEPRLISIIFRHIIIRANLSYDISFPRCQQSISAERRCQPVKNSCTILRFRLSNKYIFASEILFDKSCIFRDETRDTYILIRTRYSIARRTYVALPPRDRRIPRRLNHRNKISLIAIRTSISTTPLAKKSHALI